MTKKAKDSQSLDKRMLKVFLYIQNNLDATLQLDEMAKIACLSPYHFHHVFTAYKGESIKNYIRRLRLERSVRDLKHTKRSITEIAHRAGYDTHQSFHRAFQKAFKITPKKLRDFDKDQVAELIKAYDSSAILRKNYLEKRNQDVKVINVEEMQVAFLRHIGPYDADSMMKSWYVLASAVGFNHFNSAKTKKISIPYDTPGVTPDDKLRVDICVTIDETMHFNPIGSIGVQTIRGGKYAVISHSASLDAIKETYDYLFGMWLKQSGMKLADYPNFVVHHSAEGTSKDSHHVLDIYLPVTGLYL